MADLTNGYLGGGMSPVMNAEQKRQQCQLERQAYGLPPMADNLELARAENARLKSAAAKVIAEWDVIGMISDYHANMNEAVDDLAAQL